MKSKAIHLIFETKVWILQGTFSGSASASMQIFASPGYEKNSYLVRFLEPIAELLFQQ